MKIFKNIVVVLIVLALIGVLAFLGYGIFNHYFKNDPNPVAKIEIENYGTVELELYPEYAPNTVANFIKLAESGFYTGKVVYGKDGLCLYVGRDANGEVPVPTASMIDKNIKVDDTNDIRYQIPGEFVANGFEQNTLRHEKGVISMIRYDYTQQIPNLINESYNSANGQIGIMIDNARDLNGLYAGFGRITKGLEIIEKIVKESAIVEKTDENADSGIDEFQAKPVIKSVTVDTFGKDYGVPKYEEYFDYQSYLTDMLSQYYSTQTNVE